MTASKTGEQRFWICDHATKAICHEIIDENVPPRSTILYIDEWQSYQGVQPQHATVCHSAREWARDDDGDGKREVHCNTYEGVGAALRTYLRVFRGVHKMYLLSAWQRPSRALATSLHPKLGTWRGSTPDRCRSMRGDTGWPLCAMSVVGSLDGVVGDHHAAAQGPGYTHGSLLAPLRQRASPMAKSVLVGCWSGDTSGEQAWIPGHDLC